MNLGRYRLEVSAGSERRHDARSTFDSGFYVDASADTPDMLETALDKTEYSRGDTMTVAVTARTAGRLTLNVIADRLLASHRPTSSRASCRSSVPVGRDWGTGAYIVATLRRPLDAPAQRMPGRAIGVQWFSIDRAAKTLTVDLEPPALLRPNSTLRVPIKIDGLEAGEEARLVVAAVDVGILNLTNYKPPAPDDYYLGQRALSADVRDLYGQSDRRHAGHARPDPHRRRRAARSCRAARRRRPPVALYSGIVTRRRRRHGGSLIRHSGLCRHGAGHGGGLEQGQGRPGAPPT